MLELRLRSGQIVTFDGRIVEVFGSDGGPGARLHIAKVDPARVVEPDGSSSLSLTRRASLRFTPEEAPACERLLAALADARRADEHLGTCVQR